MFSLIRIILQIFLALVFLVWGFYFWTMHGEGSVSPKENLTWIDQTMVGRVESLPENWLMPERLRFHLINGQQWDVLLRPQSIDSLYEMHRNPTNPLPVFRLLGAAKPTDKWLREPIHFDVYAASGTDRLWLDYHDSVPYLEKNHEIKSRFGLLVMVLGITLLLLTRSIYRKKITPRLVRAKRPPPLI